MFMETQCLLLPHLKKAYYALRASLEKELSMIILAANQLFLITSPLMGMGCWDQNRKLLCLLMALPFISLPLGRGEATSIFV